MAGFRLNSGEWRPCCSDTSQQLDDHFGGAAGLPIGKLLIGGIVPGIILACLMAFFIVIASVLNPKIAPSYDVVTATGLQRFRAVLGFVPVLVIVVSVLGSIFVGLATPTEAAAVGAFMAFVLAAIYRRLTFVVCRKALLDTLNVTCMVFLIVMASMAFSQILALSGIADGLTRTVVGLDITPLSTMILMNIVVLILGSLMDPVSIIL